MAKFVQASRTLGKPLTVAQKFKLKDMIPGLSTHSEFFMVPVGYFYYHTSVKDFMNDFLSQFKKDNNVNSSRSHQVGTVRSISLAPSTVQRLQTQYRAFSFNPCYLSRNGMTVVSSAYEEIRRVYLPLMAAEFQAHVDWSKDNVIMVGYESGNHDFVKFYEGEVLHVGVNHFVLETPLGVKNFNFSKVKSFFIRKKSYEKLAHEDDIEELMHFKLTIEEKDKRRGLMTLSTIGVDYQ